MAFFDTHCHLAFMKNPVACMRAAHDDGSMIASVTVTPWEFSTFCRSLHDKELVSVYQGLGIHPWWVPADAALCTDLFRHFEKELPRADFIGEVGLDFSDRWIDRRENQLRVFNHILALCAQKGMPLSLHCVRAYDEMLACLEGVGKAKGCRPIFHWFSGTSDQLQRALALGCWFSVGKRMLNTKRGRAYVRAIPLERLLLETDSPPCKVECDSSEQASEEGMPIIPQVPYTYESLVSLWRETGEVLSDLLDCDQQELEYQLYNNAQQVFGH